jgi:hypothetical protein
MLYPQDESRLVFLGLIRTPVKMPGEDRGLRPIKFDVQNRERHVRFLTIKTDPKGKNAADILAKN